MRDNGPTASQRAGDFGLCQEITHFLCSRHPERLKSVTAAPATHLQGNMELIGIKCNQLAVVLLEGRWKMLLFGNDLQLEGAAQRHLSRQSQRLRRSPAGLDP